MTHTEHPTTTHSSPDRAVLLLEDGTRFEGHAYGSLGKTHGELVFSTAMTGYQETLTDPSHAGQIVVMTTPHIGNTGVNDSDKESDRIWVNGLVVRDPARRVSNYRAERSLQEELENDAVVGISGVDTRAITRKISSEGSLRAGIFSGDQLDLPDNEQLEIVLEQAGMSGKNFVATVTTATRYEVPNATDTEKVGNVAVLDLGVKRSTITFLTEQGFDVTVFPSNSSMEEILSSDPDGVFYSNGPGDPAASASAVDLLQQVLKQGLPFFGIGFGNQLLGRALGFDTYKLLYGHRGINQPVRDTTTGKVEITTQNHSFAVDISPEGENESPAGFGKVRASHVSLNDGVVEGIECLQLPAFSVQFSPEAADDPHDPFYLFDRFRQLVQQRSSDSSAQHLAQGAN